MVAIRVSRRAFTIVELLVVIAIIGMLIGLLLPAVNSARERGRRIQCANNLRQLGLAMQQYLELNKSFPINWGNLVDPTSGTAATGIKGYGHSWLTATLPFLEEKPIYDMIKFGQPMNYQDPPTTGAYVNWQAARQPVAEFSCPSDAGERVLTTQEPLYSDSTVQDYPPQDPTKPDKELGVTNYKACAGMNSRVSVDPKTDNISATLATAVRIYAKKGRNSGDPNTITVGGVSPPQPDAYEFDHGNGIICRGCVKYIDSGGKTVVNPLFTTADRDIRDGMSKTFAIGEAVPDWCPYSAWYTYEGTTATCGIPLNYIAAPTHRTKTPDYNNYYSRSFASKHPGGGNFCMCDGSVTFIADDIELQQKVTDFGYVFEDTVNGYLVIPASTGSKYVPGAYMNMATIDGGEVVQPQR